MTDNGGKWTMLALAAGIACSLAGDARANDPTLERRLRTEGEKAWRETEDGFRNGSWTARISDAIIRPGKPRQPQRNDGLTVTVRHKPGFLAFQTRRTDLSPHGALAHFALVTNPSYGFMTSKHKPDSPGWSLNSLTESADGITPQMKSMLDQHASFLYPHRFTNEVRLDEFFGWPGIVIGDVEAVKEGGVDAVRVRFTSGSPETPDRCSAVFDPRRNWAMTRCETVRASSSRVKTVEYAADDATSAVPIRVSEVFSAGSVVATIGQEITGFSTAPTPDTAFSLPAYGLPEVGVRPLARPATAPEPAPPAGRRSEGPLWAAIGGGIAACLAVAIFLRRRAF